MYPDEAGFITAYGTGTTFAGIVSYLVGILNGVVGVLAVAAVVLFMWGAFRYVYSSGKRDNRRIMLWSLVALFVLFSLWGIVRIMCNSFLGEGKCGGAPYVEDTAGFIE